MYQSPKLNTDEFFYCHICYETKQYYCECEICGNRHCLDCNQYIDRCPFCRTYFQPQEQNQFHLSRMDRLLIMQNEGVLMMVIVCIMMFMTLIHCW